MAAREIAYTRFAQGDLCLFESFDRSAEVKQDDDISICVMQRFSRVGHFLKDSILRQKLCTHFPNIPRMFWSKTCLQHNGFFGAKTTTESASSGNSSSSSPSSSSSSSSPPPLIRLSTWFRMIVKTINSKPGDTEATKYQWYEMSFLSAYTGKRNLLLCFDTPGYLPDCMLAMLSEEENRNSGIGPYGLHQLLLEQLMTIYDESVWDIAKIMRNNEKSKGPQGHTDLRYFIKLYQDSRHTVHSIEATQEATKVVECIAQHCQTLALQPSLHQTLLFTRLEMFKFQHTIMQGFLSRAVSNDRRMGNEQNLTSNLMSQLDSKTNVDIAVATKNDGAAMKTIAVVTMTFLPATFVSALLGMNLFSYDPSSNNGHIKTSQDLWIYFLISILLTLALFLIYWVWQVYRGRIINKAKKEDEIAVENAYEVLLDKV